jgi:hypothetical protein
MRAFPLLMLLLLAVWAMGAHAEEQIAVGEEGGDYIEADSADYVSGQTLVLTGDVIFHSESAFPGNTVEIHAESAVWDEENGRFSVPAEARMLILEQEVELTGQDLRADLKARTGRMDTVQATVRIDPEMLASESGLTDRTYVRFRGDDPKLHLEAEFVSFREDAGLPVLMFTRAKLSSVDPERADWSLKVKELMFTPGEVAALRNARLEVNGFTVAYIPRYRVHLRKTQDFMTTTLPMPGRAKDDGFYLSQATYFDAGKFSADVYTQYFTKNDEFWTDAFVYSDVAENTRVGLHLGRARLTDRWNDRVGQETKYDFFARTEQEVDSPLIGKVEAGVNIAKFEQDAPAVTSRSNYGFVGVTTPAVKLGDKARLLAGFGVHYWDYSFGDNEFLALRSRIKLAKETPWGIDYVEFQHADKFGSSPFRFHDDFAENTLKAKKNFQALPHLTGRVTANYDLDLEHFDELTVGLAKEFRAYYLGLNYNFARGSAGVELAVKF